MKTNVLVLALFTVLTTGFRPAGDPFANCAAAFLGDRMVVSEYTPRGTCHLPLTATGPLSVCTVDLSPAGGKAVEKIPFRIAIRDAQTQTLLLYSREDFRQIDVQRVLARCRKGDRLVLLTLDDRYALPHNEIVVE